MTKPTDVTVKNVSVYFIPVAFRVPLKFGASVTTHSNYVRVRMRVEDTNGHSAEGWGETPIATGWSWPGSLSHEQRGAVMQNFCRMLATEWTAFGKQGHPMEIGYDFLEERLGALRNEINTGRSTNSTMPFLAALVCNSAFDIALHDAYGVLHDVEIYDTYNAEYMNRDLAAFLEPAPETALSFDGKYPSDFLDYPRANRLPAWHLVGGLDLLTDDERTGSEPDDGYPVTLDEWIRTDGLNCLKIKLRGNDTAWDYDRIVRVGHMAQAMNVDWLTADFNCMVTDPAYVNDILDRLVLEHPRTYGMILYVEQPFPYDLEANQIDVHSVSARKPLFMDESAHDWRIVRLGRSLGWTGVALKTCKTQTGALLSLSWARAHGMTLMVQDLTNASLAMIPHALLASHAGTIMGVETNAPQFHPAASAPEEAAHPGLYKRRDGVVDLSTLKGPGFGYVLNSINRTLPMPDTEA